MPHASTGITLREVLLAETEFGRASIIHFIAQTAWQLFEQLEAARKAAVQKANEWNHHDLK